MFAKLSAILKIPGLPLSEKFKIFKFLSGRELISDMPRLLLNDRLEEGQGLPLSDFALNSEEFDAFVAMADYHNRFPKYIEEFGEPRQPKGVLERKFAEQFLSLALVNWQALQKDDLIIDVAASNSPFQDIMQALGYVNTYKTDLNYETSEDLKRVGANANDMSFFADNSATLIVSHNSWEHFEGDSDIECLIECARVLKPGGKIVIIPLVLYDRGVNTTDPSIWATKYRNAKDFPQFDRKFPMHIGTHKQRLMKFYDPKSLAAALAPVPCAFEIVRIANADGNNMALIGTKAAN